ncbi:MAG: hypothetical protein V1773_00810 [bacterium]
MFKLKKIKTFINNKFGLLVIFILPFLISACGDPVVEIDSSQYEPKISVEAFLFAGETVNSIKISRNFRIGEQVSLDDLKLTPQNNSVVVTINDIPLEYDAVNKVYYNNQILIDYDKIYTLKVSAVVEGKSISTTSTTHSPSRGFGIEADDLGTIKYRQADIHILYTPSPGTDFYAFSILADTASTANFIYNNPVEPNLNPKDVEDNFNQFFFQAYYVTNINSYIPGPYDYKVQYYDAWFYSSYTAIAYAGDENFRYYIFTAKNVQEFDGNFHEPKVIFDGDGVGVFASAIRDTVRFRIIP